MYKCQNGWTKEKMKQTIKDRNHGKCIKKSFGCKYRHEGNACFVGVFIPDENYNPVMDDFPSIGNLAEIIIPHFMLEKYMPLETSGMNKLQNVHDSEPRDISVEELHRLAFEWIDQNVED